MIANDNGNGSGVLPEGVRVCPEAEEYLERALSCLRDGLPIMAWHHTEQARELLDRATDSAEEREAKNG